jgi:ParB-like chromosome segregation protein Spo0J
MTQIVGVEVIKCQNSPWQMRTAEENPAKQQIKLSMKNGGQITPVKGYWGGDIFYVWDGGTRLQNSKELGWKHIDAIVEKPPTVIDELTSVLNANNHSAAHWLGVDQQGEVISGKAFVISLMVQYSTPSDAAHRAGVSVKEALAADWLRMEAPVELRYAIAQGRMAWTTYLHWLETEQSKQQEVVERLGAGEKVTASTAKRVKKEGKNVARTKAQQSQVPLPLGNQFDVSPHTPVLIDIRKALKIVERSKSSLAGRDFALLGEIKGLVSTCVE